MCVSDLIRLRALAAQGEHRATNEEQKAARRLGNGATTGDRTLASRIAEEVGTRPRVIDCFNNHKKDILSRLSKFRTDKNVNCYLFNYYDYVSGYWLVSNLSYRYCSLSNTTSCCSAIHESTHNLLAINDNCLDDPEEKSYNKILQAFRDIFNFVSKYELVDESQVPGWYLDRTNTIIAKLPDEVKEKIKYQLLKTYLADH